MVHKRCHELIITKCAGLKKQDDTTEEVREKDLSHLFQYEIIFMTFFQEKSPQMIYAGVFLFLNQSTLDCIYSPCEKPVCAAKACLRSSISPCRWAHSASASTCLINSAYTTIKSSPSATTAAHCCGVYCGKAFSAKVSNAFWESAYRCYG